MKAILIDVVNQTITETTISNYKEIYQKIGNECSLFTCPIEFENSDVIYVDDEGLLKEVHGGFMMNGWNYPLIGNAIILGTDEEGESVDYASNIEEIKRKIIFCTKEYANAWKEKALATPPIFIGFKD